ncbi:MAG TPA: tRNA (adenosine(37)-N6)-dimethylallyltransferase MiaA [Flavobacteriaceae bacterium]|nr:tRNA (adenosine(37)-N6)-dimethylallyltransferase MiaA [Flavobacteriaceae bacterium]
MNNPNASERFLIVILGPTGIGKTRIGIELAKHFSSEIISADSRQFFKEMNIGTAVPTEEELDSAPHWFVQHKSIYESYSVGDFEREALQKLNDLFQKHRIVFMVGGSGLYLDAVVKGLDKFPAIDPDIRENLEKDLEENGIVSLQEKLKKFDPEYAKKVDIQNPRRVIRALEICIGTSKPYSHFLKQNPTTRNFSTVKIGLTAPRELIYARIENRVDKMLKAGLLKEVEKLRPQQHLNALKTVGYKEFFPYFEGETTLENAVEELKKNTRRFAKRQLTWFRKDQEITWFPFDVPWEEIADFIAQKTAPQ